jgi:hypothetical protein
LDVVAGDVVVGEMSVGDGDTEESVAPGVEEIVVVVGAVDEEVFVVVVLVSSGFSKHKLILAPTLIKS